MHSKFQANHASQPPPRGTSRGRRMFNALQLHGETLIQREFAKR
jgi:hypothetical protein